MRTIKRLLVAIPLIAIATLIFGYTPIRGDAYTIYFESDRDGDTVIYQVDYSGAVAVTGEGCKHPSVTADGSILVYTRITETNWGRFWNAYYIRDEEEHRVSRNEIYDELEPVISRDGTFVAYATMRADNLEIVTVPMDAGDLQFRITESEKPDDEPALASGDEWVYWTGRTGNHSFLFKAPGRGGDAIRISAERAWEEHPSVSADGRYIAYAATIEENTDIWVLDTETDEQTRLTTDEAWDGHPCISADGKKIVFTSDRDENYEIYIINCDGTGLDRITDNEAIDDYATIT